jgi:hypothetical protein
VGGGGLQPARAYSLAETPVFARSGAVLPTRGMESAYSAVADPLTWLVVQGSSEGEGALYEDDGVSVAHREGAGATTRFSHQTSAPPAGSAGSVFTAVTSAPNGTFEGVPTSRAQRVALKGVRALPASATCDGQPLHATKPGGDAHGRGVWLEEDVPVSVQPAGSSSSLVVACGALKYAVEHRVEVRF